jgi:hypothetical protein
VHLEGDLSYIVRAELRGPWATRWLCMLCGAIQAKSKKPSPWMTQRLNTHKWTMLELLSYQIPLPLWVAPKRRGRPLKRLAQPEMAVAV